MRQRSNSQRVAQVDSGQRCGNGAETNYNAVVAVTDLRVSYRSNNSVTLFTAVDNVQGLPVLGRTHAPHLSRGLSVEPLRGIDTGGPA